MQDITQSNLHALVDQEHAGELASFMHVRYAEQAVQHLVIMFLTFENRPLIRSLQTKQWNVELPSVTVRPFLNAPDYILPRHGQHISILKFV